MFYAFFWHLNFTCRRFRTLCLFHLHWWIGAYEDGTDSVLKQWHIKFRHRGITQKNAYNIFLLLLLSVGLPVANALDVLQPCGLLYYP